MIEGRKRMQKGGGGGGGRERGENKRKCQKRSI